ncbi:MAG: hypothetical protein KDA92_07445 [Planctomycetales bacterium]|nr:hypothetical protein [Planctomycetales bacterium]
MSTPEPSQQHDVAVVCSLCKTRFYVSSQKVGRKVKCPDCHSACLVQAPAPPPKPRPLPSGDEYRLADDGSPQPQPVLVRVSCGTCGTLMYAKQEHVGKRIRCPDCQAISVVPQPQVAAKPFEVPDVSDVQIDAGPPPRIDETRKEVADRLMAEAMQHVQEQERQQPTPPKHPMIESIYSFPFYPSVISTWVVLGIGAAVEFQILDVVLNLIAGGGYAMILVAFVIPVLAVFTGFLFSLAAPKYLDIIEFTSEGYDKPPYWPAHDFGTRARAAILWVNALAMASAPGMIIVSPFKNYGVPVWLGFISTLFLLAPIVLSMLERDSAFVPYSPFVFQGLRRHQRTWLISTLHFVVLGIALAAIGFLAMQVTRQFERPWMTRLIEIFAISIALVIASRVIGRLAYVIAIEDESEADDEDESREDDDAPPTTVGGEIPDSVGWR